MSYNDIDNKLKCEGKFDYFLSKISGIVLILGLIMIIVLITFSCCSKPDIWKNGKPYNIYTTCVKDHTYTSYEYHYGWSWMYGKYCFHYGIVQKTICDKYQTDTLLIE